MDSSPTTGSRAFALANAVVVAAAAAAVLAGAGAALAGCAAGDGSAQGAGPTISLAADHPEMPADGISAATVTAHLAGAPAGTVVSFALSGVGLLGATNVGADNGVAAVTVWAPFEDELSAQASFTSKVTASVTDNDAVVPQSVDLTFTVPETGAPVLNVRASPDRVVAGGADVITLVIDGRRLTDGDVTLSADSPAVALPASVTLDDQGGGLFHGEVTVPAPADPVDVTVSVAGEGGAVSATAVLHFIAADAPAFDLTGTFAQVSYGAVRIGDLIFLDPDPQCVVAPSYSLVHLTQTGNHVTMSQELCAMSMPDVTAVFGITSHSSVDQGFIDAANQRSGGDADFDLDDVGAGAAFDLPGSAFPPLIVGAALANPSDALPTSADDPRTRDDDNDGHPGVTVHNSSQGDQYTCYRTVVRSMNGTIESSDFLSGDTEADTETNIFNGGGLSPTVTSLASPYALVRVDGLNGATNIASRDGDPSSVSCSDVIAYEAELQQQLPPPNVQSFCQ